MLFYEKTSKVFEANYTSTADIIVNQGGSSSGKTFSILQVLGVKAVQEPVVITIVGQDIPNLKKGALRDWQNIVANSKPLRSFIKSYNKTDRVYEFTNGSLMEFTSFKDDQDAKSGKRDYAFFNEADGTPYDVFDAISIRTKRQVFIDYNPTQEFWAHTKILANRAKGIEIELEDGTKRMMQVQLIKSTYKHNPFIPPKIKANILAYKETDPRKWKIFGMGELAPLDGVCISNWKEIVKIPDGAKFAGYGIDFGYSVDPTALVELWKWDGGIIWNEVIYETGLDPNQLGKRMVDMGVQKMPYIFCDSSAPQLRDHLRRYFNFNVVSVKKTQDSLNAGIELINSIPLWVTAHSNNLKKELRNYVWMEKNGQFIQKPIDKYNHGVDAARYFYLMGLKRGASTL